MILCDEYACVKIEWLWLYAFDWLKFELGV